ncbi:carbohydrate sulfotransferase 8-like [Xyrichtys novacula]|uniref:Carbohydrate sulfotransferase n=1 Tax=Xyrichtys novacula TaxID=13765 RepID=A0AAV1HD11_XYRNO|nr:carbohydrate sulfotransferase 8-like [Xyrichtys novacula]
MMKPSCPPSSLLWLFLLLVVGSLPLLFYLEDFSNPVHLLAPAGWKKRPTIEKVDVFDSEPADNKTLEITDSSNELQQQGFIGDFRPHKDKNLKIASITSKPSGQREKLQLQEDLVDSDPAVNKLMNRPWPSDSPAGWKKKLQQQARIQNSRHRLLDDVCSEYYSHLWEKLPSRQHVTQIFVEDRSKLLYCEVPKAGCSNWKRVLMVLAGKASSVLNISHDTVHKAPHLRRLRYYKPEDFLEKLSNYTKILFVRDPFERLVSAFRDKFENSEKHYHFKYGRAIISRYRANASEESLTTGDGVTFREFVQYLLDPRRRPVGLDVHWRPVSLLCHPCLIHYDFIGKFENMNGEANFLLQSIGAPPNVWYPDYKDRNPQDKRTSSAIMKKYFSQLNATERQRVYDFYRMDHLMFNYSKPLPHLY